MRAALFSTDAALDEYERLIGTFAPAGSRP
jgi:hypothetical protein